MIKTVSRNAKRLNLEFRKVKYNFQGIYHSVGFDIVKKGTKDKDYTSDDVILTIEPTIRNEFTVIYKGDISWYNCPKIVFVPRTRFIAFMNRIQSDKLTNDIRPLPVWSNGRYV